MVVLLVQFALALVWVCFLSWVVARFAFREEAPLRRAALTAGTSWLIATATGGLWQLSLDTFSALALLLYMPAAAVDFLMLWRAFGKAWIDDDQMAETFQ